MNTSCAFCKLIADENGFLTNDDAIAIEDLHPLNPGHCLVLPRRHEADFFQLREGEQRAMLALLNVVRATISDRYRPEGFNVGINVGEVAGQTVPHVHVHLIPRYQGDVPDPRGGIRWIIPARAPYWQVK